MSGELSLKEDFDEEEIKRKRRVVRQIINEANRKGTFNPKLLEDMLKRY